MHDDDHDQHVNHDILQVPNVPNHYRTSPLHCYCPTVDWIQIVRPLNIHQYKPFQVE